MWHSLAVIAQDHFLDKDKFFSFANDNEGSYGVVNGCVSSCDRKRIVAAYRKEIGEDAYCSDAATEYTRQRDQGLL